ncbi:hypothetical protein [Deinococcus aquiradiocola]|uniref:Uncharacterized protein n=1 Tax=Deinococcus aquiradiocola TaxID=393059 RepID=A0A917PGY5_9DEIO|nr:hypothetical protein [Deinococcus aquiradiocola]GGJ78135.1 hypothetical protein GCM10008939_22630 [Deinococcus aquiradiocola]
MPPVRHLRTHLTLLCLLLPGLAGAAAPNETPACLDARAPDLAALPITPLDTRVNDDAVGILLVRLDGGRILVQAADLPLLGPDTGLPDHCRDGDLIALPDRLRPVIDPSQLTLQLTRPASRTAGSVGADLTTGAPGTTAPQTAGAIIGTTFTVTAAAGTVTGTGQFTVDARPDAPRTPGTAAWGVRGAGTLGLTRTSGVTQLRGQLPSAYAYRQQGDTELQAGLLPPDGPLAHGSLLGLGVQRRPGLNRPAPLRLDSATAGRYRVSYEGATLAQGPLTPGVTDLPDFSYPPVQGTLTVDLETPDGTLLRRFTVPFDQRPQRSVAGQLQYAAAAGLQPDGPAVRGSVAYTASEALQLAADALLGPSSGLHLGVRWRPGTDRNRTAEQDVTFSVDALAQDDSTARTLALNATLTRSEPWGSWNVTAHTGQDRGRSGDLQTLSLQASAFITHPLVQLTATAEQQTQDGDRQRTLRLGAAGPLPRAAGTWSAQAYTRDHTDPASRPPSAGVSVQVALNVTPTLTLQGGTGDGTIQLSARQHTVLDDWTLDDTLQVWPTPLATASLTGPVNATLTLTAGPSPQATATVNGTLAVGGKDAQTVTPGTRQVIEVRVGAPGVTVTRGTDRAVTGRNGTALLPVPPFAWAAQVTVDLESLPLSVTLDRTALTVQPAPDALVTVADFTPYLQRSALRQLPPHVPVGADARLGDQHFTVPASRYIQLNARNGDRVTVTWTDGHCEAVWSGDEQLTCEAR